MILQELEFLLKLVAAGQFGFGGIVFVIWFVDHKKQEKMEDERNGYEVVATQQVDQYRLMADQHIEAFKAIETRCQTSLTNLATQHREAFQEINTRTMGTIKELFEGYRKANSDLQHTMLANIGAQTQLSEQIKRMSNELDRIGGRHGK